MFSCIFAKIKFSEAAAWVARVAKIIKCVIQALAKMVPQEMTNEFIMLPASFGVRQVVVLALIIIAAPWGHKRYEGRQPGHDARSWSPQPFALGCAGWSPVAPAGLRSKLRL